MYQGHQYFLLLSPVDFARWVEESQNRERPSEADQFSRRAVSSAGAGAGALRFMGINNQAIASYPISLYCSLAVHTPDALAVLASRMWRAMSTICSRMRRMRSLVFPGRDRTAPRAWNVRLHMIGARREIKRATDMVPVKLTQTSRSERSTEMCSGPMPQHPPTIFVPGRDSQPRVQLAYPCGWRSSRSSSSVAFAFASLR